MTATRRIASILTGTALGFGLLASAAPVAQATGSHKESGSRQERSSVDTSDWPQGKSQSDPDGMSNGGWDKPGGSGGTDRTDQDGNNGCGNDNDREDDNNGNCGSKQDKERAAKVKAAKDAEEKACSDKARKPQVKGTHKSHDKRKCPKPDVAVAAAVTTPAPVRVEAAVSVAPAPAVVTPAPAPAAITTPAPATTVLGAVEAAPAATTTPPPAGTQVLGITETRPDTLARTGFGLAGLLAAAGACFGGGRLFGVMRRRLGS